MPRLQWTAPAPKTVKIEVSADGNSWETVVDKVSGNGFTVAELKGESNTNDDHYELFPIPEKSISVSNVLRQNPGYGGGNEMTKEEAGIYSVKQID